MKLSEALLVPPAEVNTALLAAGLAPAYAELPGDHASLHYLNRAVEALLSNHLPFPALAFDRYWTVSHVNTAAASMLEALGADGSGCNLLELLIDACDQDGALQNWHELATMIGLRLRRETLLRSADDRLRLLQEQLEQRLRMSREDRERIAASLSGASNIDTLEAEVPCDNLVVPLRFRVADVDLSLFSMVAHFGSVQEVSLGGLSVELFFPNDACTEQFFEQLAASEHGLVEGTVQR